MALVFPSNPSTGTVYTGTNGLLYTFDGVKWLGESPQGSIIPSADLTYDLGSTSTQWRHLYVGTTTIYIGGTALSVSGGNLTVDGSPVSGGGGGLGSTLVNGTYTVSLTTTGNVVIPNIIRGTTPEGITLAANYTAYIVTDYGDNNRTWTFDGSSGETILPNGTIIGSDGNVNTIISVPGVTTGTFVDWAFEPNGKIVLPNLQSIDSSDPITLVVGTADAKLTLDNFNQAALLQAKKSFVRNFYENDEANFSYTNVGGQGTISITLTGNGLYFRTLLQRLADQFSGNLQFPYSYSNIQATVNPGAENIVTTVTNVIQGFGPNDYVMEVNQLPDPDPFTFTNITISYDYLNTVGVDVDKDIFGISTDNDDIDITSGRDINLRATDDLRLTAGSILELELSQLDGQESTDGLEIRVSNTLTTHSWMYRFDGVTQLPSGLTASPISNFVPVNGTVLQQTENEILQVMSKGLSGGMTVGWAENPFEPSKVAALTFNATTEQVRIETGSYTGTVNTWAFDQTGTFTTPQGAAIGPEGMGWPGFSNGVSGLPLSIVNKNPDGLYLSNITLYASGSGNEGIIEFTVWNTETVVSKTITINTAGYIVLPGGGVINGNDYDVEITANNDGASTFGSVNINTQGPPAIYTVVQQTSPYSPDTITTDIGSSPFIGNIVAGMTVTGSGIVVPTTVSAVTGPDIYGTYSITISPASGTGLNYTETYTFTSAGGVTNRNWEFNSLGELYLPQGGAIQETQVTNELWGTTTTSLTLVPAGAANGTQRLEIYSTGGGEGNHIHITSGDQDQTALFLGNDTQYFAVSADGANYIQARNGYASPNPGTSAGPGANVNISAGSAGDNGGNVADGNSGGDVFIASGISSSGLGGDILINTSSGPDGFGTIELSTDGGSSFWAFNKDNQLIYPDGTTSTGSTVYVPYATSSSYKIITEFESGPGSYIPTTFEVQGTKIVLPSGNGFIQSGSGIWNLDSGNNSFQFPNFSRINYGVGGYLSTGTLQVDVRDGGVFLIRLNDSNKTWTFDNNGALTFPDGTTQTTAFAGGSISSIYSGIFTVTNITSSTSTQSGAIQVAGGIGVGGTVYASSLVVTGSADFSGASVSGISAANSVTNVFMFNGNSGFSMTQNIEYKIPFDTSTTGHDSGEFNLSTSTYTPLVAGWYLLETHLNFTGVWSGNVTVSVYKNNNQEKIVGSSWIGNGGGVGGSALVYFNGSTDTAEIRATQASGGVQTLEQGAQKTWFQATWIKS